MGRNEGVGYKRKRGEVDGLINWERGRQGSKTDRKIGKYKYRNIGK